MLRLVALLVCLGALEAAAVAAPRTPKMDAVVHAPLLPRTDVVIPEKKKASEPTVISLVLQNTIVNGQQYFVGEITVGTPGQPMSVVVDVTNRLSYVPSVNCSDPFCTSHRQYDSSASSTYEEDGTPFELPAGLNASGVFSKDNIGVASVTAEGQIFGEATAVWNSWSEQAPNDGVLGLGFGASTPQGVTSLLDTMADQGLIAERVAGLWLGRNPAGGELTLGGLNDDRHSGDLAWATILLNPEGWVVSADSIAVGETGLCSDYCHVHTISTSPYFFMSMEAAKAVNDALGGIDIGQPGVAALDCATLYTLPNLKMEMAGRTFEMSPLEYTLILPFGGGVEMCVSGFIGVPGTGDNLVTVGTLFLQKFYTAYDMDNMRVGFADSV